MSDYLNKLKSENPDVALRYIQKIAAINNIDPFCLVDSKTSVNPDDFPPVTSIDIVSYLVLTCSYYTKEQMKAYKSLNSFKYFEAGFVSSCRVLKIGDKKVIVGKVKHSQRMNNPSLSVWIICNVDGSVDTGHCTCMAGLGEVCSHVGALLYAVEFITTRRQNTSCTDVRAMWNVPTVSHVEYKAIKDMKFGRVIPTASTKEEDVPALEKNDIVNLLKEIQEAGEASALMRVVEPFASDIAKDISNISFENPYSLLYKEEYEANSLEELRQITSNMTIVLSEEECTRIMLATRKQAESVEWFKQRAGRITASRLKQVCHSSISKPSLSLIKQVCYPTKFKFRTKATEWGRIHEAPALKAYEKYNKQSHNDTEILSIGFCIKPETPQIGASPDALVKCSCCGVGAVEIKCPYVFRNITLFDYVKLKSSCIEKVDNIFQLKKDHSYFYQVQARMAVTGSLYCDFFMWSPKEFFIERIYFNDDFWCDKSDLCIKYHNQIIMPELLGRYFTKTSFPVATFCKCNGFDDGTPMIACDNDNCAIQWYHMSCVGILHDNIPTVWYCLNCSKNKLA